MSNNIHGTVAAVKHEKFHLCHIDVYIAPFEKVQVGKDQEKAQSVKDSHSTNQDGKKPN